MGDNHTSQPTRQDAALIGRACRWAVCLIAPIVVVASVVTGYDLLNGRFRFDPIAAVALPAAVACGLVAGLYVSGIIARFGHSVGWLTAVRWICAVMELWLNCADSVLRAEYGSAVSHSFTVVLLTALTEADQHCQAWVVRTVALAEAAEAEQRRGVAEREQRCADDLRKHELALEQARADVDRLRAEVTAEERQQMRHEVEHEVRILIAAEAAEQQLQKRAEAPKKQSQKQAKGSSESSAGKRSLTDPEAVALLIREHPDENPSKRDAQALLKIGFLRIDSIFEIADRKRAERRAKSASKSTGESTGQEHSNVVQIHPTEHAAAAK